MRRVAILAAALALGGCAVGPHYREPVAAPATAAPLLTGATPGRDPAGELPPHWWSLYDDAALDALVAEALAHNSDLRVAAANLERAQAVLREQRGALLPTTTLTTAAVYGRGGAGQGLNTNAVIGSAAGGTTIQPPSTGGRTEWVYRGGGTFAYEVDLFGRVRRSLQAARADLAATEATRDATRVTVAAATTQAYLDACAIGRQIDVAQSSLKIVGESYAITKRQLELGAVSDYEVSRVGVLVEQTRALVPQLQGLRAAALTDLTVLLGRPATQVPDAAALCRTVPVLKAPIPVGDGAALLRRRPDVRAAERSLAGDVARVGVATAALFPSITLGGALNATGINFDTATSRTGVSFGLGPLISWNFPNLIAARARMQQAGADARASLASFDGTVLTALGEAEKALSNYQAELARNAALAQAQAASQRAYELSGARLKYGALSQLEQIDVQRDLISAQAALAASDATLVANQVAVFRALGGGWQDAPAIDPAPRAIEGTAGLKLKAPQP